MRWITDDHEFREIFLRARTAMHIDSYREKTELQKFEFDDCELCSTDFFILLKWMMLHSGDKSCAFIVLDPDPVHYFHRHFGKYSAIEFLPTDSDQEYIDRLNENPGENPADAIGTNCNSWAVVCPSERWFVHALRSDDQTSGHLWIPAAWGDELGAVYPWAHPHQTHK